MAVKVYGINHIALEVTDIDKAVAFYSDVFNLRKKDEGEGDAFFQVGEHQFLALFEVKKMQEDRVRHFGFIVQVQAARFGGKGEAARYRLADEPYLGQPPGMDFTRWRGAAFRRGLSDRTGQAVRQDRTGLSDGVGQRPRFPSKSPVRRRRTNLEEDSSHLA